jgi:hypothetical protein
MRIRRYGGGVKSARVPVVLALLAGCSTATREAPPTAPPPTPPAETATPAVAPRLTTLDDRLIEVAREYSRYPRTSDLAWAPAPCASLPPAGAVLEPPTPSRAATGSAHGDKLFWVYAQDGAAYTALTQGKSDTAPAGLAVVKEAWRADRDDGAGVDRSRTVKKDGHVYVASVKVGLFVMAKLDAATPGTDSGWIYGTANADGTSARRATDADACAGCHRSATHDRIFGPTAR